MKLERRERNNENRGNMIRLQGPISEGYQSETK